MVRIHGACGILKRGGATKIPDGILSQLNEQAETYKAACVLVMSNLRKPDEDNDAMLRTTILVAAGAGACVIATAIWAASVRR